VESESFRITSGHVESLGRGNYANAERTGQGRGEFYIPRQQMISRAPVSSGSRTKARGLMGLNLVDGKQKSFSSVSNFAKKGLGFTKAYTSVFTRCLKMDGFLEYGWLVWLQGDKAPTQVEICQYTFAYEKLRGEKK